jgi:hypothetical protein
MVACGSHQTEEDEDLENQTKGERVDSREDLVQFLFCSMSLMLQPLTSVWFRDTGVAHKQTNILHIISDH